MSGRVTTVYDGFCKIEQNSEDRHIRVRTTDAVAVLVYNKRTDNVILVTQNRFAMERSDNSHGVIDEVVAGRFDRDVNLIDLIIAEVKEEIGVEIEAKRVRILNNGVPLAPSPGILTERIYLAVTTVDVDESDGLGKVYGVDGEKIIRLLVPVSVLDSMIFADLKTWGIVQWFLAYLRLVGRGSEIDGLRSLRAMEI